MKNFEFLKSNEMTIVITLAILKSFGLVNFSWWIILGVIIMFIIKSIIASMLDV